MSDLLEDTPTKQLSWLLGEIQQREIALPDFQRDFVWDPSATQELIISVANNYPAGSLLAIRNASGTQSYFAAREFQGAPLLHGHKSTYLILDGQQRLTSLYQAFYGTGEYHYFLSIKRLIRGMDIDDEDVVFHVRADAKRGWQYKALQKYATLEGQADDLILPLKVLFGQKDGYLGWADNIAEMQETQETRRTLKHQLNELRSKFITNIENYKFPVVLLSDRTPADAVCTIFETLNRTGVKLSVFDLLTARFWPEGVKLRDMWKKALEDKPIIQDYQIDPYYILQIIALLRTEGAPSCKRKDVLELTAQQVQQTWDQAVDGLVRALTILQEDCGVLVPQWLPYNTIVIPFAAIIARTPIHKGLKAGDIRLKLVCWFWCSVFGQAYENSPNSQTARDLADVTAWITTGIIPDTIATFSFDPMTLYEVTPKQRALYRGVIALILSKNPRDFHAGKPITRTLINDNNVDDHHVFPDAYLEAHGIKDSKNRDCVLNRTLIDRNTNQSISRRSPHDYFGEMRTRLGEIKFNELLTSHLLPTGTNSPITTNDFDTFLRQRCELIGAAIKEVTQNA